MTRIYDEIFTPRVLAELGLLDATALRSRPSASDR